MGGWSAFTKTIAKDAGIEPLATDKEKKMAETKKGLRTGMVKGAAEAASKTMRNQIPNINKARDFTPAWEGADISEQRWNSMSKKEKDAYTEKYGD